jgi:L-iditol 2-dehydrogenase
MTVGTLFLFGVMMKAIVVKQIGTFEYLDVPTPSPGPGEVVVKVAVAGLCRTDIKLIDVGHRDLVLPRIPAEEVVGTVVELGDEVDQSLLHRLVYVYPGTSCGECRPCRQGAGNLCRDMQIMGFHRDGGFAEYVAAPVKSLIPVPDACKPDLAVMAEPLSCCLNALELGTLQPGESIGIWGGGPAGAFLSRAALAIGAAPTVIEPDAYRRELLGGVAQASNGQTFDVAVVAVGSPDAYHEAMQHLAPRGRLVLFSGLLPASASQVVDFNVLHYLEQSLVGAYGCSYRHGAQALEWIGNGDVRVDDLITHRMPLSQLGDAMDLVRNRECMKILLYPES